MNTFGHFFRLTLSGESHGKGILLTLDGVPAGLEIDSIDFATQLLRRRKADTGTTPRQESDHFDFLTGVYRGYSTGAPLSIFIPNEDARSADYEPFLDTPRPGHADFVSQVKYFSHADSRGGGIFSGRLTVALVIAGTIARTLLARNEVIICAEIDEVGGKKEWYSLLQEAIREGDSLGGTIVCTVTGATIGLGEPFFNSLESLLSHALFSIPGVRAVEFGNGFAGCSMRGSAFNDRLATPDGSTCTNHCGGIVGGLSNGNPIYFRVGFRPTASIAQAQETLDLKTGETRKLQIQGRHDACFVLRCPVIVESVAALVLYDLLLARMSEISAHTTFF